MDDLNQVIARYHNAATEFIKGDPAPYKELFSQRDDVTLANPFGPAARGWDLVAQTMERAAANSRDGEGPSFENVAKYVTDDLAYIVEVERFRVKVGGGEELVDVALRTTSIASKPRTRRVSADGRRARDDVVEYRQVGRAALTSPACRASHDSEHLTGSSTPRRVPWTFTSSAGENRAPRSSSSTAAS
jgi:hypothetical protein